jgi:hypothetical protein
MTTMNNIKSEKDYTPENFQRIVEIFNNGDILDESIDKELQRYTVSLYIDDGTEDVVDIIYSYTCMIEDGQNGDGYTIEDIPDTLTCTVVPTEVVLLDGDNGGITKEIIAADEFDNVIDLNKYKDLAEEMILDEENINDWYDREWEESHPEY